MTTTNVVAVKRATNNGIQMQFAQVGEVTIICDCPNGSTENIKIEVKNCDSTQCIGPNLVPNAGFETFANCLTAPQYFSTN